jgi:hypothetical protein
MPIGMSTEKENLDFAKAEAFFKSPAGFWTVIVLIGTIAVWAVVSSVINLVHA